MIISLPKNLIRIERGRRTDAKKSFRFSKENARLIVPQEVRNQFNGLGVDIFVSPTDRCLYLTFGPLEKTQFRVNFRNGYVASKQFFNWATNAEIGIFDDYEYTDYQIDKKNKIVKLNLERE